MRNKLSVLFLCCKNMFSQNPLPLRWRRTRVILGRVRRNIKWDNCDLLWGLRARPLHEDAPRRPPCAAACRRRWVEPELYFILKLNVHRSFYWNGGPEWRFGQFRSADVQLWRRKSLHQLSFNARGQTKHVSAPSLMLTQVRPKTSLMLLKKHPNFRKMPLNAFKTWKFI